MYRKATLEDCKAVYKLICDLECRELPFDAFAEIFAEQVANGNYYCLLWEQEGSVVAALNLRFERQLHHASRIAEIVELAKECLPKPAALRRKMAAARLNLLPISCVKMPTGFTPERECIISIISSPNPSQLTHLRKTPSEDRTHRQFIVNCRFSFC